METECVGKELSAFSNQMNLHLTPYHLMIRIWLIFYLFCLFKTGSCCIAQTGHKPQILLSLLPERLDSKDIALIFVWFALWCQELNLGPPTHWTIAVPLSCTPSPLAYFPCAKYPSPACLAPGFTCTFIAKPPGPSKTSTLLLLTVNLANSSQ